MARILIAGFGSILHGDDGFGVEVASRLQGMAPWPEGVEIVEVGTGGIHLVQRLLDGFDALLVADAMRCDGRAGALHLLEAKVPDLNGWTEEERRDFLADMHYVEPSRALIMAKALGALPPTTFILGCEAENCDEMQIGLSDPVAAAIEPAILQVERLVRDWVRQEADAPSLTIES